MAIGLLFFSIIIPIDVINRIDNFDEFLKNNNDFIGKSFWYDKYLFREGAMSLDDIDYLLSLWEKKGIKPYKVINNIKSWDEMCVVDSFNGPSLTCDWLLYKKGDPKVTHINDKDNSIVIYNENNHEGEYNGCILKGNYINNNQIIKKGIIRIDDYPIAFNFDSQGNFKILISEEYIIEMNKTSKVHKIHLYDFNTDNIYEKEFVFESNKEISITIYY